MENSVMVASFFIGFETIITPSCDRSGHSWAYWSFLEIRIKILEDAPPEYLNPDYDENENPCFFRTVVRGAEEEIGIDLPESDIKFLSFGLETKRYQYALVGIAETDLSIEYIRNAFVKAKDARLEYSGFYFVPFTPEEIYNFMVKYRPWGPEAEYGLYQALLYKFDSNRVRELFEDYPHSR